MKDQTNNYSIDIKEVTRALRVINKLTLYIFSFSLIGIIFLTITIIFIVTANLPDVTIAPSAVPAFGVISLSMYIIGIIFSFILISHTFTLDAAIKNDSYSFLDKKLVKKTNIFVYLTFIFPIAFLFSLESKIWSMKLLLSVRNNASIDIKNTDLMNKIHSDSKNNTITNKSIYSFAKDDPDAPEMLYYEQSDSSNETNNQNNQDSNKENKS